MALIDKENLKANIIKMLGISGEEYLLPAERALWNVINAEPTQEIIHCEQCANHHMCALEEWTEHQIMFCGLADKRGDAE